MKTAELDENEAIEAIEIGLEPNASEGETKPAQDDKPEAEAEEDEVIVSIGEEAPPQEEETRAPEWVRELRKANREKERKIRELEAKLNAQATTETKPVVLSKKPTLEDCDYDSDAYEQKLADWYEQKRSHDEAAAKAEAAKEEEAKAWQKKLDDYAKAKTSLKVRDYEDAEATALETFNVTQQGIVLQGSDNPALLIYAIGKNASRAKELASITDPVKFAFAVAKLETQLKVTNRKAAPAPERAISSKGGSLSGSIDSTLERLRAEALKTGDLSKVVEYKRRQKTS
jgi:hypothetical protein